MRRTGPADARLAAAGAATAAGSGRLIASSRSRSTVRNSSSEVSSRSAPVRMRASAADVLDEDLLAHVLGLEVLRHPEQPRRTRRAPPRTDRELVLQLGHRRAAHPRARCRSCGRSSGSTTRSASSSSLRNRLELLGRAAAAAASAATVQPCSCRSRRIGSYSACRSEVVSARKTVAFGSAGRVPCSASCRHLEQRAEVVRDVVHLHPEVALGLRAEHLIQFPRAPGLGIDPVELVAQHLLQLGRAGPPPAPGVFITLKTRALPFERARRRPASAFFQNSQQLPAGPVRLQVARRDDAHQDADALEALEQRVLEEVGRPSAWGRARSAGARPATG